MNLRYCMMTANLECKQFDHPQSVMKKIGITYSRSVPQSLYDQWWFYDCKNTPAELPKFLKQIKGN